MEILLATILSDDVQHYNENLSLSCNAENVKTKGDVKMFDYNNAAVTEPETVCFSLKTAAEMVSPIENVLILPKQPV